MDIVVRWMFALFVRLPLMLLLEFIGGIGSRANKFYWWCDEFLPSPEEPEWFKKRRLKKQAIEHAKMVERVTGRCQKR